jgi:hypothetical protein
MEYQETPYWQPLHVNFTTTYLVNCKKIQGENAMDLSRISSFVLAIKVQ